MLDTMFDTRIYDMGIIWNLGAMRSTFVTSMGKGNIDSGEINNNVSALAQAMGELINDLKESIAKYGQVAE